MASVRPLLPAGWAGFFTEQFLQQILDQMVCDSSATVADYEAMLEKVITKAIEDEIGKRIGSAELKRIKLIAKALAGAYQAMCMDPNKVACGSAGYSHDDGKGHVASCYLSLCKGPGNKYSLSGFCSYSCTKGEYLGGRIKQECCCGTSYTQVFSGISWENTPYPWSCGNFKEGKSEIQ